MENYQLQLESNPKQSIASNWNSKKTKNVTFSEMKYTHWNVFVIYENKFHKYIYGIDLQSVLSQNIFGQQANILISIDCM